ncbi:MAG: hypothetical protein K8W52_17780, partial [Deltaproteobacteria bacterium]|nr:hypothetical protein [Deltaproteobacteria bacterium]
GNRLGSAAARLAAASAASEPAPAPRGFPFGKLLAVLALIGAAAFAYTWWRGSSARDVQGAYTSAYLDMEMQLPPGVWHSDPEFQNEQSSGQGEVRQELLTIGPEAAPERMLMVGHARLEAKLPTAIDDATFRSMMQVIGQRVPMYTSGSGVQLGKIACDVSPVRPRTGVCRAEGALGANSYGAVIYLWFASIEDVVSIIYFERGSLTREAEVEALLRSATLL